MNTVKGSVKFKGTVAEAKEFTAEVEETPAPTSAFIGHTVIINNTYADGPVKYATSNGEAGTVPAGETATIDNCTLVESAPSSGLIALSVVTGVIMASSAENGFVGFDIVQPGGTVNNMCVVLSDAEVTYSAKQG